MKQPPRTDADGVPIDKMERIKYRAKQKMDDTKAAAKAKAQQFKARATAQPHRRCRVVQRAVYLYRRATAATQARW